MELYDLLVSFEATSGYMVLLIYFAWYPIDIDTSAWSGTEAAIELEISAENTYRRELGFDLLLLEPDTSGLR